MAGKTGVVVPLRDVLSICRPRPERPYFVQELEDQLPLYSLRHNVRPGITGWAQINGWRGETDTADKIQRRVECDLYYIESWSLLLDLYIIARTPLELLRAEKVY